MDSSGYKITAMSTPKNAKLMRINFFGARKVVIYNRMKQIDKQCKNPETILQRWEKKLQTFLFMELFSLLYKNYFRIVKHFFPAWSLIGDGASYKAKNKTNEMEIADALQMSLWRRARRASARDWADGGRMCGMRNFD